MTRRGFTLVEVLVSVAILGVVAATVALVLSVGVETWRATAEMAEETHDGDAVMEQLVMALRSAYYPTSAETSYDYGFQHEDGGEEEKAQDSITWTKSDPHSSGGTFHGPAPPTGSASSVPTTRRARVRASTPRPGSLSANRRTSTRRRTPFRCFSPTASSVSTAACRTQKPNSSPATRTSGSTNGPKAIGSRRACASPLP